MRDMELVIRKKLANLPPPRGEMTDEATTARGGPSTLKNPVITECPYPGPSSIKEPSSEKVLMISLTS